jgi:hypothetical protein
MFGHESRPSRIWSFGAKPPVLCLDAVREQMFAAHRYRNALVELERTRREKVEARLRDLHPELVSLDARIAAEEAELESARTAIKRTNSRSRSRSATPQQRVVIAEIRARLKDLRAERKAARKEAFASPQWIASQERINDWASSEAKRLRAESGLHWGTYLTVEQSMRGARSGAPPVFRRWTGDGRVAVQLQGGLSVDDLLAAQDRRLRVEVLDGARAVCRLRIGSEGREPIWAQVPMTLHRELPADAQVKWAYLLQRRIGTRTEWRVQLVLARESWEREDRADSGAVGVDMGWRLVEEGLRVAYWVGDDGEEGELILPRRDVGRWAKADDLRSIRDRHFNLIRDVLAAWIKHNDVPEWLAERVATLSHWRSAARLAAVVLMWRDQRFAADAEPHPDAAAIRGGLRLDQRHYGMPEGIFALLEAWRKKDKHLYDWECSQRVKAARWRDDMFRNFAAMLRRKYRTARVKAVDWKKMTRAARPEEDDVDGAVRHYRRVAAVGRLLQLIDESMEVERLPPMNTTRRCHECDELSGESNPAALIHCCENCGATWDQDRNAAVNLLRAGDPATCESAGALA